MIIGGLRTTQAITTSQLLCQMWTGEDTDVKIPPTPTWSSYSSSSSASSHALPSPGSSTLQFQPLPHAHVNASRPHKNSNSLYSSNTVSPDLHSPYGVLISDADQPGSLSADPQRLAILRTLKADGPHGTFSLEDPRAASSSRYECSYCQKRFNRPSSLRVCSFSAMIYTCADFIPIDTH